MTSKVLYEIRGPVGLVSLNSPRTRNAMDAELGRALTDILETAAADKSVRALVLTGRGRAFSAGADVLAMKAEMDRSGATPGTVLEKFVRIFTGAARLIGEMEKPVIAAVGGAASGGGLALALACDLVTASESAVFDPAYVRLGLVPVGGVSQVLAEALGAKKAAEFLFMAEPVSARSALEMGLVNRVSPDGKHVEEAMAMAEKIASHPKAGIAATKRLLRRRPEGDMQACMEAEVNLLKECGDRPEHLAMLEALIRKLA